MKQAWLDAAEIIDALRVIPRIMLFSFFAFYMWYIWITTNWYFQLTEPGMWDTTFISTTVTAIGTMLIWIGNTYINSGRRWNGVGKG